MIANNPPASRLLSIMTSYPNSPDRSISRRAILKNLAMAPLILRAAPLVSFASFGAATASGLEFSDVRLMPHYPALSPLADVLRLVPAGSDEYVTEKYAEEIEAIFRRWGQALKTGPRDHSALLQALDASIQACPQIPAKELSVRSSYGIDVQKRQHALNLAAGRDRFVESIGQWLAGFTRIETAEFEIYGIRKTQDSPLTVLADIRYDLVGERAHDPTRSSRWLCARSPTRS